ncbi:MAG: oxaloacetate decarboxylase, partial [Alphaproteobacteria bacterium]
MRLGQASPARATTCLRALLHEPAPLILPGCFNAMSARILEHAGFPALYMSGYGTSLNLLGLPDAGLITLTEMALNAKLIASAVRAPLIADADTGFGNAINVVRTVEEYIRAGVAGLHLEDQVAPKRCGHVAGREVIARDEAVLKIRAACKTRDALDSDFVIIARTDARGAHGGSMEEAITRANAFLEAGADLAFVEGPKDRQEVAHICQAV